MPIESSATRGRARSWGGGVLALVMPLAGWAGLSAAGAAPSAVPPDEPARDEASADGFRIDPDDSWVVAVTETAGLFGFLGHRHAIEVTGWSADVAWQPDEPGASRADFTVAARDLRIDTAQALERAGLGDGPDEETVAELQEKMLGPANLHAAEHPELHLELTRVAAEAEDTLRVAGELTVRGRTEPVELPVAVGRRQDGGWEFTGSFTVRQSDFGIEPESVAGVVKVADPVEIRFRVATAPPGV